MQFLLPSLRPSVMPQLGLEVQESVLLLYCLQRAKRKVLRLGRTPEVLHHARQVGQKLVKTTSSTGLAMGRWGELSMYGRGR